MEKEGKNRAIADVKKELLELERKEPEFLVYMAVEDWGEGKQGQEFFDNTKVTICFAGYCPVALIPEVVKRLNHLAKVLEERAKVG